MVPPVEYAEQHYGENPVVETTETREPSLQQTRCDSGWRRGLKGLDLVAAAILCCVKGCVGSLDQSPRGVLGPSLGKPDADGLAARHEAEQTGRNGLGLFNVASGQGEGELFPAPSGDDVTGAQLGADGGDKVPQQYVAGGMAVGVVVVLEVVIPPATYCCGTLSPPSAPSCAPVTSSLDGAAKSSPSPCPDATLNRPKPLRPVCSASCRAARLSASD